MNSDVKPFSNDVLNEGAITIWRISGMLNEERVQNLKTTLNQILHQHHYNLILDFDGLVAIDSRGLGFLVTAQREVRSHQGRMVMVHLGAQFAGLFELTRLNRIFEIFMDMESAKRSFGIPEEPNLSFGS